MTRGHVLLSLHDLGTKRLFSTLYLSFSQNWSMKSNTSLPILTIMLHYWLRLKIILLLFPQIVVRSRCHPSNNFQFLTLRICSCYKWMRTTTTEKHTNGPLIWLCDDLLKLEEMLLYYAYSSHQHQGYTHTIHWQQRSQWRTKQLILTKTRINLRSADLIIGLNP